MSQFFGKLPWVGRSQLVRVAVIGDLILDEYLKGSVDRISPEAPVPVHLVRNSIATAGGAANAARNVQLAGGSAVLFGVMGDDEAGTRLKEILHKDGIDVRNVIASKDRPTIRKTRVLAGNQQIVRIDWERTTPISEDSRQKLLKALATSEFDALLLSDYGKGGLPTEFLREIISIAKARSVPCVVDPKGRDFAKYQGCFLITPNRKEACEALDLDSNDAIERQALAKRLQERFGLNHVLVTLGADGMYLQPSPNDTRIQPVHLSSKAREVFDVSGAGDTVVAVATLAVAAKADLITSLTLANVAAGCVVEKIGTQPIYQAELEAALLEPSAKPSFESSAGKILTAEQLHSQLSAVRGRKKIVFTNGCFDLLHEGHVTYLEAAREKGHLLVVGVNSDRSISAIKGPRRPIVSLNQRMRVLAAMQCVDFVVSFDEDTPLNLIKTIMPDVLVKGADWAIDAIVGAEVVMAAGGRVENIELVPGQSTTGIINRILEERR